MVHLNREEAHALQGAGASGTAVKAFEIALKSITLSSRPTQKTLAEDCQKAGASYRAGNALLSGWPGKTGRDANQTKAAEIVKGILRKVRNYVGGTYREQIYSRITGGYKRHVRAEELVYAAAEMCPGLCPSRKEVETELKLPLAEKEGVEQAQGDFMAHVLADPMTGNHLLHGMLRPLPQSRDSLERFKKEGRLDLGTVQLERRGPFACVLFNNTRYLNAEDDTTLIPAEIAVDAALLDDEAGAGLLRGNPVDHPKYKGRRIFSSGLNLSRLYGGQLPFMFYVTRDLGFVNKIYRGIAGEAGDQLLPDQTVEKPWIAVVEGFAIGGGCQLLPVVDYVIAEKESYFNLPARKEGIIPGAAPIRMSRFTGARNAREGILFNRTFNSDSPDGRTMVNEVLAPEEIDPAIARIGEGITAGGIVSFGANRKAIRMGEESLDLFRRYMAFYCREQANCHFNPALVENLEKFWVSRNRENKSS